MSKSTKPIRQEYIAKVRYSNNLPPPPLNPKFFNYITEPTSSKTEGEQLISSLFRKENFTSLIENVDEEFGMNLNLINNAGFLDDGNDHVIYNMKNNDKPVSLHPKDRSLLRDVGIGTISKSEPGVSFLRRTEYIAERNAPKSAERSENIAKTSNTKLDPSSQLKSVENTFDQAQDSMVNFSKLVHPRRKHLKAVNTWPLLPDTSMMDTKYLAVKFIGSASINRELALAKKAKNYDEKYHKDVLESTILKPITSADGEWISMYQVKDPKKVAELNENLHSTRREQPVNLLDEDDSVEEYKFKHSKNYEMKFHRFVKQNEELCIKFIPEPESKKRKAAYYYPVSGKIDLKKYRASTNSEVNRFLKESTVDAINFKLREPSTTEIKEMDSIRSEFDPMEYEGEEEEEEVVERDVADEFNEASKEDES